MPPSTALSTSSTAPSMAMSPMEAQTASDAQKFATLTAHIQLNQWHMPVGLWLADRILPLIDSLPQSPFGGPDFDALPEDAWFPLDYSEGFPVLSYNGEPVWERLPGESMLFYRCFEAFLASDERQTSKIAADLVKSEPSITPLLLKSLHTLFYWDIRAKGYDRYIAIATERKRRRLIREMNDTQHTKTTSIVNKVLDKFDAEDGLNELDGAELISLLKATVHIQRQSVGADVPAHGGSKGNINIINTVNAGEPSSSGAPSTQGGGGSAVLLEKALRDPKTAAAAQELILRMQAIQQNRTIDVTPGAENDEPNNEISDVDLTTPGLENLSSPEYTNA